MKRLATLVAAALVALIALPASADAAQPERTTTEFDVSFVTSCPGFDLAVATTGQRIITTFVDSDGNESELIRFEIESVQTRVDTGATATVTLQYIVKTTEATGESDFRGLITDISVDGEPSIYRDVGRQVFDIERELTFQAGQYEEQAGSFEVVCAALA